MTFLVKLKIPKNKNFDSLKKKNFKAIVKGRKHPSIIAIASECTKERFSFNTITITLLIHSKQ